MINNDIYNELGTNFIEYAVAVNTDRAIPDSTSGLKPVAKRILWDAHVNNFASTKPHVKCAQIVGDTMARFHPHGDSSIYEALVRLSRSWIMRYPLIDFHGSNGNIDGDGPAAYRYTECRLSKVSEDGLFAGIKKKNVDFTLNYNENEEEPCTLPAIFPNLLCNPNSGIGVSMACCWLPHNLKEVAQAIYDYMDGKEPSLPGPDFPTGGIVINKDEAPAFAKTGRGTIKVRGKYHIDKNNIIFTEIPYGETIEGILDSINDACEAKEIEGIVDARNETNKKGVKIVIECAKTANLDAIVKKLFAKTRLQSSISYNQVALVNKKPVNLTLIECIKIYINHNIECLKRELNYDMEKHQERVHIIDGLLVALEDIDNVINLIKKSENAAAAKMNLMTKYKIDEDQAKAILAMRLSSLAKLEKIELENERKDLVDKINDIKAILNSTDMQKMVIRQRLEKLASKYGDARRTELAQIDVPVEKKEKEEIVPEDVVVVVSQTGDVKRIPTSSFKVQKRNGKGVKTEDDAILTTISTNTVDALMIFTTKGKMYKLVVDNVPVGSNTSKGIKIDSLVKMEPNERVVAVTSLNNQNNAQYVVFITKQGMIKKTKLEEYSSIKKNVGIIAIKLKENDMIANVLFMNDENLILVTKEGMGIHFETKDIAPIGRVTMGVKSIKLNDNDEILIGIPSKKSDGSLAIFTQNGYARKTSVAEVPVQGRTGKGVILYRPTAATGEIVNATLLNNEDNVLIIGRPSSICINEKDIPEGSRVAVGNLMIKNSKITSVVKL